MHFGSPSHNVMKVILKSPIFIPFWGHSNPIWANPNIRVKQSTFQSPSVYITLRDHTACKCLTHLTSRDTDSLLTCFMLTRHVVHLSRLPAFTFSSHYTRHTSL